MILTDFLSKNKGWIVRGQSAAVDFTSMQEFSAEKSSRLPDEPIEKGSFSTYNRIIEPRTITCRLSIEGGASKLQSAIDRLTDLCENNEKITLTTPEQSYKNMMLESFDYRRDATNGRGVLFVDLRFKEIREVKSAQTTTSVEEAEEPIETEDAADGSVCDDIDDGEMQGVDASAAEEEAEENGRRGGVIYESVGVIIPSGSGDGGGGGAL
jgi:hypothetical protein